MEEKKSNKLLYGILGAVALILGAAVLLFVILGGSIKTFKGENVQFSPINDPVCEAVYNFSNQFDKEHLPISEYLQKFRLILSDRHPYKLEHLFLKIVQHQGLLHDFLIFL